MKNSNNRCKHFWVRFWGKRGSVVFTFWYLL